MSARTIRALFPAILLGWTGLVSAVESAPGSTMADLSDHAVVLMFDDGWHSVFTCAYPLLMAHGMKVDLPLISDAVKGGKARYAGAAQGYMNRAEVQEMIDNLGAEISSHSRTHPFLTRLSDEAARDELVGSKQALEAMFRQRIRVFVYPYGDHDQRIRNLVRESGYALARSIRPGTIDFVGRPYDLPAIEVRQSISVEYVKRKIENNRSLILFFHRIVPSPSAYTEWPTNDFAELLDWLDDTNVQVVTLDDLYEMGPGGIPERPAIARRNWKNRIEWELLKEIDADVTRAAERR